MQLRDSLARFMLIGSMGGARHDVMQIVFLVLALILRPPTSSPHCLPSITVTRCMSRAQHHTQSVATREWHETSTQDQTQRALSLIGP